MRGFVSDIHEDAQIGEGTRIAAFVYIEGKVKIGTNCIIKPHVFICDGVQIGHNVFIGPGVVFTNDKHPELRDEGRFVPSPTVVMNGVSIGAGSVILSGIVIGEGAIIGAGSVVTRSVEPLRMVYGNPAH